MKEIYLFEDVFGMFGGIEKVIVDLVSHADSKEFHFNLLVNSLVSDEYLPFLQEHNVAIQRLQESYINNPLKRHLKGYRLFKEFLRKHPEIETIHFNISNAIDMRYVQIAKKAKVKKRIAHSHNDSATSVIKLWAHRLLKPLYAQAATDYIACSYEAGKWLFGKKILKSANFQVILNGIDFAKFAFDEQARQKIRAQLGLAAPTFLIGNVGRFNRQKNQSGALAIFAEVAKQKPDAQLLFIGAGDKSEIKEKAKKLDIAKKVIFQEPLHNINEFYSAMDAFLFPSLYEGLGIAFIEAQANGLPCVISNAIPQIATYSDKVVSFNLDKPEIAINALLKAPLNSHKYAGMEQGKELFDVDKQCAKIFALYR